MGQVTSDDVLNIIQKAKLVKDAMSLQVDKPLREQGIDSLDFTGVLFNVEETFGIKIPDQDIDSLETVNNIVVYINDKLVSE